tara:strand:+ start:193 stop:480 length:288 start_codon:yes stop_codon:yes gene_type:complete
MTYSEIIPVIPTKKTVEHWNTTLKENAYQNRVWFHTLSDTDKELLVEELNGIHYASVYHDELVKLYEREVKQTKKDLLKDAFDLDDDLTTLTIKN